MQALLIKNDDWCYVTGEKLKPEIVCDSAASVVAAETWKSNDEKARSDILLSISPSELRQVKNYETSRKLWLKLEEIHQSKGPAKKATLLKYIADVTADARERRHA